MKLIVLVVLAIIPLFGTQKLLLSGSTTIQPVIEEIVSEYQETHQIALAIDGGGSDMGIEKLRKGQTDIAMVSRPLNENEKKEFSYRTIGYDAIAVIVHKTNPLNSLTKKQLIDIYRGKINSWDEIGGKKEPILLISKKADRGTMHVFENATGLFHPNNPKNRNPELKISPHTWDSGANNDAIVWVGGIYNAIGFISVGSVTKYLSTQMPIKILAYEGVKPSKNEILTNRYPLKRELNLVYSKNNPDAVKFINFMVNSPGQNAIENNHFIRINDGK